MGKGKKTILISGFILAFVAGTMVSGPQVIAANPVLEEVRALLLDPIFGLEEIKNEVRNIEDKVTNIENILESEPPAPSCEELGFTDCFGTCKDTSTDEANCGSCGNACNAGEVCSNGVCQFQCAGGTTACFGQCVNLQSDEANCGSCGNQCGSGELCSNGVCSVSCQPGLTNCAGTCVDTQSDESHCGGCGTTCASGESCENGTCEPVCVPSTEVCTDTIDNDCDGDVDAADSDCAPIDFSGDWSINPAASYSCASGQVNFNINQITVVDSNPTISFSTSGNPNTMVGNIAPDNSFTASHTIAGGCSEIYTISGTFIDSNTFSATLTANYPDPICSLAGCFSQVFSFTGTR